MVIRDGQFCTGIALNSEFGFRIQTPNPNSESKHRIRTPNLNSESEFWIQTLRPNSESKLRIRIPFSFYDAEVGQVSA